MTPESTPPRLAVSAKEAAWARFRAREVAPIILTVSNAGGGRLEWSVTSYPWWLRAAQNGDRLVLRLVHYGPLEGIVGLVSNGGRETIRVSSRVRPPLLGAMVGAVRSGLGGLLGGILAAAFLFGTLPWVHQGGAVARWEEFAKVGLPIIAVALLAACWGWVLGGPRLGLRAALSMLAACALLLAMIALAAGAAGMFPWLHESPLFIQVVVFLPVVLLPSAVFGMILGGKRIALASAWRLTLAGLGMTWAFALYWFLGVLAVFVQLLLLGGTLAWFGLLLAPLADNAGPSRLPGRQVSASGG